ncbi:MAG: protein phosphatase 2C domain-containing protein [Polyangiales bacterium]
MRPHVAARTNTGRCRERNEDAFTITDLPRGEGVVVGVYDGCGSVSPTEGPSLVAAQVVHEEIGRWTGPHLPDELGARLDSALSSACSAVWRESRSRKFGLGTTAMICGVIDGQLSGVQVGDARAYLVRGATLVQLSRDDTLLQDLLDQGQLAAEDAEDFELRNVITRALGTSAEIDRSSFTARLSASDRVILVTDGIWRPLAPVSFHRIATGHGDAKSICDALIDAAEAAGGHDNQTVVVIDCRSVA